ncbi:MAG: EAL domain-containing protein [Rhodospirillales bacterium]
MIDHMEKGTGDIRILVADDEQTILDEYAAILAHSPAADERRSQLADLEAELFGSDDRSEEPQFPEFSLTLCHQSDEAVRAVEASIREGRPFAIAFLDVRMPPGPDGVNAAERIRKLDTDINIVFVTGYSDISPDQIRKRIQPPDKLLYCQKPFHAGELRQVACALSAKWTAHRNLQTTRQKLEQVVTSTSVIIYSSAPGRDHSPAFISDNVQQRFGWAPESFRNDPTFWIERVHREDLPRVYKALKDIHELDEVCIDYRFLSATGDYRWVSDRMKLLRDASGKAKELVGCWFDITDRRQAEARIRQLAYFDVVTGLPNRLLMQELLQHGMEAADRYRHRLALLFLDVDNFKRINDTLGHDSGDALLREVAKRLLGCIRKSDLLVRQGDIEDLLVEPQEESVSRLGGDEFVIILSKIKDVSDAARVAGRISQALATPISFGEDEEASVTATIGISVYPDDGATGSALLKHADMAMYDAKEHGRNCFRFFSDTMRVRAARRFFIESKLAKALDRDEFRLFYQPRIDLGSLKVVGMEALLRWQQPDEGLVSPAEFIPIAEENGLILPIGDWVLHEACRQTAQWQTAGLPLTVSINLSAVQFRHRLLVDRLAQVLTDTGIDPALIELELTESVLMDDTKLSASLLAQIKELGIKIAVDDFGTGYSSLSYLKRFALSTLKIDTSFVRDLTRNPGDEAIVGAMIALGHRLGLQVVAEGVEQTSQLDLLRSMGCNEAQGYLFSRPIDAVSFEEWVRVRSGGQSAPEWRRAAGM